MVWPLQSEMEDHDGQARNANCAPLTCKHDIVNSDAATCALRAVKNKHSGYTAAKNSNRSSALGDPDRSLVSNIMRVAAHGRSYRLNHVCSHASGSGNRQEAMKKTMLC